ncbi:glycosyltransferase [candidate division KSB1 bacterium]|nr:glycosyltransferase [candidate division KSB1 bacterium]
MKICDLTQAYHPGGGGIRTYIHEKRKAIEKSPHRHLLIVPGSKDRVHIEGRCKTYSIAAPLIPRCKPYRFAFRLDKVLDILRQERPHVVELGSAYILPYAAFHYRRTSGAAVVGFYHTDYPDAYVAPVFGFNSFFQRTMTDLCRDYVRWIYNQFDRTFAASEVMNEKLLAMGVKNIQRVSFGVDTRIFNPRMRDSEFRRQLGLNSDELVLVYSGRLDHEKRIDILLQAFQKISMVFPGILLLIGDGPLRQLALKAAEKNNRIHVIDYQHHREGLARYLASSDIYVSAGPHETFALSVVEAQACGLAVVGVNSGALKERVTPDVGVLAQADSVDSLAEAILDLSYNGYLQKGKNACRWMADHSWEKCFERLLNHYEKLCLEKQINPKSERL